MSSDASPPPSRSDLLPGTLDLLVLQTLSHGPMHGYGIAQHLKRLSADVLQVEEGSLYPALQRLRLKGLLSAEWRRSPTGRRARYYSLTTAGERARSSEQQSFDRLIGAIRLVLDHTP